MWRLGEPKHGQVGRYEGWVNLNVKARWANVEGGWAVKRRVGG